MKIGILECGHAMPEIVEKHGDFSAMFEVLLDGHGLSFTSYDVEKMSFPDSVDAEDGWLLTGSRHGAYEDHPFIEPLEQFIRDTYAAPLPMVGICFGHQIIAQALGGHVQKFGGGWSVGVREYKFDGLGAVKLNAWHQDQVISRPDAAKVIARNDFCENAALLYGNRVLTIQPHPEFTGDVVKDYVRLRRGTADYPEDLMDKASNSSHIPTDSNRVADMIAEFFLDARTSLQREAQQDA